MVFIMRFCQLGAGKMAASRVLVPSHAFAQSLRYYLRGIGLWSDGDVCLANVSGPGSRRRQAADNRRATAVRLGSARRWADSSKARGSSCGGAARVRTRRSSPPRGPTRKAAVPPIASGTVWSAAKCDSRYSTASPRRRVQAGHAGARWCAATTEPARRDEGGGAEERCQ